MHTFILALETSSTRCSVGLFSHGEGRTQCTVRTHDGVAEHAQQVLPMVDELLAEAALERQALSAIAFGQGPGAFTGLRVACGMAQGMALGLGVPVIPVSSLLAIAAKAHASLAHGVGGAPILHVVLQDARMGEAYAAAYGAPDAAGQPWRCVQAPLLLDQTDLAVWLQQWSVSWSASQPQVWLSGDLATPGEAMDQLVAVAPERIRRVEPPIDGWAPDACVLARLAWQAWLRKETLAPDDAMPLYVRNKVAFTIAEREQGAGGNPRAPELVDALLPMLPAHLEKVAAIEARVQSFPWSLKNFQDALQAGYPAWVSVHQGEVTGYAIVMMAPDVAHLLVIGVDPAHQGKGVGRRLIELVEGQARQKGLTVMVLEVRKSNHQAKGFYRHMGYQTFSIRKDYYPAGHGRREDACAMKKSLPSVSRS